MFKDGILVGIKATLERRRLGELLLAKGLITQQDLKSALALQKQTRKPIGKIFIETAAITRHELRVMLWKQMALRTCATVVLGVASFGGMGSKRVHAGEMDQGGARLILASTSNAQEFSKISSYPAFMGMSEKRSSNLKPFTKWTGMFARFESQMSSGRGAEAINAMETQLEGIRGGSIKEMANAVNDMMNAKPYILDKKNWGQSDYWATPAEFMQRGGDCEDYAIAKYAALRTLGVPEERMRIAIVQDTQKNIPHAVLVVYAENGSYILDNQSKNMLSAESGSRYRPIYSINRQAWWLHSTPGNTMVASAQ